jgi:cytochrome b subunit of formate dehydrogenase
MVENMAFYCGMRSQRPAFRKFDYTQKAEYWAVIWGTVVMGLTGFILWFPTIATQWTPAWAVRVSEVIHYYEAILAVSAIFIWHFFYVIFMPSEYPMSLVWLDGKMSAEEWKKHHRGEYLALGDIVVENPGGSAEPLGDVEPEAVAGEPAGVETEEEKKP